MIIEHNGSRPSVDPTARIAPNAVICGDVTIGAHSSIGFGTVVTAETGPVSIGSNCVIMENAVLRGTKRNPLRIADSVLVGPTAYLSGCTIEDEVFLATNVSVFNGATVGKAARVRIGAIVHLLAQLQPGTRVPVGWVVIGDPAKSYSPDSHMSINAELDRLQFLKQVFGVSGPDSQAPMKRAMQRYSKALGSHRKDRVLSAT